MPDVIQNMIDHYPRFRRISGVVVLSFSAAFGCGGSGGSDGAADEPAVSVELVGAVETVFD